MKFTKADNAPRASSARPAAPSAEERIAKMETLLGEAGVFIAELNWTKAQWALSLAANEWASLSPEQQLALKAGKYSHAPAPFEEAHFLEWLVWGAAYAIGFVEQQLYQKGQT